MSCTGLAISCDNFLVLGGYLSGVSMYYTKCDVADRSVIRVHTCAVSRSTITNVGSD